MMALQSMTGFARTEGESGRYSWVWEIRSVNGKGLDMRLRLPPGFEHLEAEVRKILSARFTRGNMQVSLNVSTREEKVEAVVNEDALNAILDLKNRLAGQVDDKPLSFDTLLLMRGVVDFRQSEESADAIKERDTDILIGLEDAVQAMLESRRKEGGALKTVLIGQLETLRDLVARIEKDPSRSSAEIAARLQSQLEALLGETSKLDETRLHAEAALLATKADIREELDRLKAHVIAGRELLDAGKPVGRKLDFLAQEFNRETNTICSKSNAIAVTTIGLEMKVVIDQFREQVQNLE